MDKDTVTMWGAVIAAVTGVYNLWIQFLDRRDRYVLRWGRLWVDEAEGLQFYVMNTGKHDITMRDYGYVYTDGKFASLPQAASDFFEDQRDHPFSLLRTLEPHRPQQAGGWLGKIDGVYAISAAQRWPRVAFRPGVSVFKRLFYRLQIVRFGEKTITRMRL